MSAETADLEVGRVIPNASFTASANHDGSSGTTRPTPKPICHHCGAPLIDDRMRASGFCCAGCSYVYRLVHEHGLAGYYRIKDEITAPADPAVFQPRDYGWLETLQLVAEGRVRSPSGPGLTDTLAGTQAGSESRPHLAV